MQPGVNCTTHQTPWCWPKSAKALAAGKEPDVAVHRTLPTILATHFPTDEHWRQYEAPSIAHALAGGAVSRVPIRMVALGYDADDEEKDKDTGAKRVEWWTAEKVKIARLCADQPGLVVYSTLGGYRIAGYLPEPFAVETHAHTKQWWEFSESGAAVLLIVYKIRVDPLHEWTRCFRAPYVMRDGVRSKPEFLGAQSVGSWSGMRRPSDMKLPAARASTAPPNNGATTGGASGPVTSAVFYRLFAAHGWVLAQRDAGSVYVSCPWAGGHSTKNRKTDCVLYGATPGAGFGIADCFHCRCLLHKSRSPKQRLASLRSLFTLSEIDAAKYGDTVLLREIMKPVTTRKDHIVFQ